jgi:hypothetical protein
MADRQSRPPLFEVDAILRKAYFGVWVLSLLFSVLAVWGIVRYPHWSWVTSVVATALALAANQRLRNAYRRGEAILLGVATLLFVVISGVMLGVALRLARS